MSRAKFGALPARAAARKEVSGLALSRVLAVLTISLAILPTTVLGALHWLGRMVAGYERTGLYVAIIGIVWVASSGFSAAMESLNIAYDAGDDRSFWQTRFLALLLTFTSGTFLLFAFGIVLAEPRLGPWFATRVHRSELLILAWPYLRWSIPLLVTFFALETLHFLGPNVKQRFLATLPGVLFATVFSVCLSEVLEICLRLFANFHLAYVSMAVFVLATTLWLNWTGLAILAGATLNLELSELSAKGRLREKHAAPSYTKLDLAA